ncbi:hypothetical protein Q3G72_012963 [Acer saccharum]|nr:hypothetical protein Q3G72_012963 [Acer saccharum]
MNTEEIVKLCDGLSIKEKKGPARTLEMGVKKRSEDRLAMSLVGKGGPWSFDRATIIFDKPSSASELQDIKFKLVDFWVQIHNLPLLCLTEEIGSFLGSMIGEVHDMDLGAMVEGSSRFLRVRVTVEVDRPLQ